MLESCTNSGSLRRSSYVSRNPFVCGFGDKIECSCSKRMHLVKLMTRMQLQQSRDILGLKFATDSIILEIAASGHSVKSSELDGRIVCHDKRWT